jgi:hypothetical protein
MSRDSPADSIFSFHQYKDSTAGTIFTQAANLFLKIARAIFRETAPFGAVIYTTQNLLELIFNPPPQKI